MRIRLLIAFAAAVCALTACGAGDDGASDAAATPAEQLDFTGDAVGGGTVDASEFVGSDLVIWFWAPW